MSQITRPRPISGFPEWLPEIRMIEQQWLESLRATFESWGFAPIETPAVETLDTLLAKGETDKEIYALRRLQADAEDASDAKLALHYDLTVPLARYVAQHFNDLVFPFKRYQMQKVWRGERPQEGRFREFLQCDIDVIGVDSLPIAFDAELPLIVAEGLARLGVTDLRLHVSNRKILSGFACGLGVADPIPAIRILDKLDKIGAEGVRAALTGALGVAADQAERLLALGTISSADTGFVAQVEALGVRDDALSQGLEELATVMQRLTALPHGQALADLSIARGFDYYTGTVYEARLPAYPGFGSVVSGGRYDDLASGYINKSLPGVGISIGLSRLFAKLVAEGRITAGPKCPTQVLVVVPNDDRVAVARETADGLRRRGLAVELFHAASKLKRQLAYAERKGIPYVWFPPFEDGADHEVKDMTSGAQGPADPATWQPPAATTP